jgi:hypothetical protein
MNKKGGMKMREDMKQEMLEDAQLEIEEAELAASAKEEQLAFERKQRGIDVKR